MGALSEAAAVLPPGLRREVTALPEAIRDRTEEVRLRCGRPPTLLVDGQERPIPNCGVTTPVDLSLTVEIATRSSTHTALERVRQGYFTVKGGHRIGLCGSAAVEEGRARSLTHLSSLNLRVARQVLGCGERVYKALLSDGAFQGALLLGPPGSGKTTLLRDLVRLLSEKGLRVGLADERGEVAALWEGTPQFDVGPHTDVMEGLPKAQALLVLLRGMGPQVLVCDEVTDPADLEALTTCANCGVALLATVHGANLDDLSRRPFYQEIIRRKLFAKAVTVSRTGCTVEDLPW